MSNVIAILSMLHESADQHSAIRLFRQVPVLDWTLKRLSAATTIDNTAVLCWDDQLSAVNQSVAAKQVGAVCKGPRQIISSMNAITAARKWCDGWRSGLLGTCDFDLGFHPLYIQEMLQLHDADCALLVDPAAGLVDPELVESLLEYANTQPAAELCFMNAAPGLTGTLLRRELIERLTIAAVHPGRLLNYFPDQHGVDPIGKPGCAPVPTPVSRSNYRFKLDSDRQIARADRSTAHLNGHLISTDASALVANMRGAEEADRLPREVVLELTTRRESRPVFWPGSHQQIDRADLSVELATKLFCELGVMDDIRLTLSGVGDPLLSQACFQIIAAAKSAGISAIGIETDLINTSLPDLQRIVESGVDFVSVHFPAATSPTYSAIMGIDGFSRALRNIDLLEELIKNAKKGIPLIAMLFTKLQANLAEMEPWYDYWLRRFGHAVIKGPSDFGQLIPDLAVADMSPQIRRPCVRLDSRMTILSDGRIVSCEQDVSGKQTMGSIGETPIQDIWRNRFVSIRASHQKSDWASHPLCGKCREWHRA